MGSRGIALLGQSDVRPKFHEERFEIERFVHERYGPARAQHLTFERVVLSPVERHARDHDDWNVFGHIVALQIHEQPLTRNSRHPVIGNDDIRAFRHRQNHAFLAVVRPDDLDADGPESSPKGPCNIGIVVDNQDFRR